MPTPGSGQQRRAVVARLDRGDDDYLDGKISEDFWTRKSEQWEAERRRSRLNSTA